MLYYMNWLTHDFWTRTGGFEFDRSHGAGTSSPSHWQQVEEQAPKPVGGMMSFLLMTFVPVQKLCVNIYIYIIVEKSPNSTIIAIIRACACWAFFVVTLTNTVHFIYIYIYMLFYMRSVFFRLPIVSCVMLSDDNSVIPGCLWLLVFVLNNNLILGICCSTIPHLPGCFCPWTFFQNIGFNMVPSDPFMSHLATQLGYSAG